ncbi:MAG: T9SS type A sorting domain-containing protein [Saprospiraceae bacterium]
MFLISNAEGAIYQWIDCNTKALTSGQTNKNFVSVMNGNYAVVVMQNNCLNTSACYTFNTIGEERSITRNDISIYPNPSHGFFTIKTDKKGKGIIEISNYMGEIIHTSTLNFLRIGISLKTYSHGIYFVHIYYERGLLVTKELFYDRYENKFETENTGCFQL